MPRFVRGVVVGLVARDADWVDGTLCNQGTCGAVTRGERAADAARGVLGPSSLYSLLTSALQVLHRIGGEGADSPLPRLVAEPANTHPRPFLGVWHASLEGYEGQRPAGVGAIAHERVWPQAASARRIPECGGPQS
ncbi:hypothetical protein GCM10010278_76180 [Streptomyces melanogenes]|nr:hypothetical protein GCM10010278_76180 [Streptomyces melanogenes]